MALARRPAAGRRGSGTGLRPGGVAFSALLHLGLAAVAVFASLRREKPSEPLPPPAYAVHFEAGAPDRPAEEPSDPAAPPSPETAPAESETASEPAPPAFEEESPAPETTVEAPPPEEPAPEPPSQEEPRTAEADPVPPTAEALPPPPPPAPQQQAALTAPPRPARPPQPERLPGIYLPDARLNPAPSRPGPPHRGLDLSPPSAMREAGRDSPEAQLTIRGAKVGPDWRNAFRRWIDEHVRYPVSAAVVGQEGEATVELVIDRDGRVRSGRLIRGSGSVWLDHGTVSPFRNAVLPPFPPDADQNGIVIQLTIRWVLRR